MYKLLSRRSRRPTILMSDSLSIRCAPEPPEALMSFQCNDVAEDDGDLHTNHTTSWFFRSTESLSASVMVLKACSSLATTVSPTVFRISMQRRFQKFQRSRLNPGSPANSSPVLRDLLIGSCWSSLRELRRKSSGPAYISHSLATAALQSAIPPGGASTSKPCLSSQIA